MDNYVMNEEVANLMRSRAHFKVLAVLCQRKAPLPLRHLALLSKLPIYSVENALADFVQYKISHCHRAGQLSQISLNRKHPLAPTLEAMFSSLETSFLEQRALLYEQHAPEVLNFCDSARDLFSQVAK